MLDLEETRRIFRMVGGLRVLVQAFDNMIAKQASMNLKYVSKILDTLTIAVEGSGRFRS